MLISGHYICPYHVCTYAYLGVINRGHHDSPYIRKSSLDHDSAEKNRGCRLYRVTHTSPSLTARPLRRILTRSPTIRRDFKISKKIRARLVTRTVSRSHSPVPQTLHWSQTESIRWSLECVCRATSGGPPL